jgi:hypothetical protein
MDRPKWKLNDKGLYLAYGNDGYDKAIGYIRVNSGVDNMGLACWYVIVKGEQVGLATNIVVAQRMLENHLGITASNGLLQ